MNRQTYHAKNDEVSRDWHVVDATDQVLGRLAGKLAVILMGKHKPTYTPHHDVGDFVVVTHAEKIRLTGRKATDKFYRTYSGHPSGQKYTSYGKMLEESRETERATRSAPDLTHLRDVDAFLAVRRAMRRDYSGSSATVWTNAASRTFLISSNPAMCSLSTTPK